MYVGKITQWAYPNMTACKEPGASTRAMVSIQAYSPVGLPGLWNPKYAPEIEGLPNTPYGRVWSNSTLHDGGAGAKAKKEKTTLTNVGL
jgi:hypothetical protein